MIEKQPSGIGEPVPKGEVKLLPEEYKNILDAAIKSLASEDNTISPKSVRLSYLRLSPEHSQKTNFPEDSFRLEFVPPADPDHPRNPIFIKVEQMEEMEKSLRTSLGEKSADDLLNRFKITELKQNIAKLESNKKLYLNKLKEDISRINEQLIGREIKYDQEQLRVNNYKKNIKDIKDGKDYYSRQIKFLEGYLQEIS